MVRRGSWDPTGVSHPTTGVVIGPSRTGQLAKEAPKAKSQISQSTNDLSSATSGATGSFSGLNTSLMDTASEFNGDRIFVWDPNDRSSEYGCLEICQNPLCGPLRSIH